jgi:hypothetical protein
MLVSLSILIPAVVFWYDNIRNYKKIELINQSILEYRSHTDDHNPYLITNININSLVENPITLLFSKKKWVSVYSSKYRKLKLIKEHSYYPFKNKVSNIDEYIKTTFSATVLDYVNGIDINPLITKLTETYKTREAAIIVNNAEEKIVDEEILIDGSEIIYKDTGSVYYNYGIPYNPNSNLHQRCTIIGKVNYDNDIGSIDPDNSIIYKQDTLDINTIKNSYLSKIKTNNYWFGILASAALIIGIFECRRKLSDV